VDVESQPLERGRVARRRAAEAEVLADDDDLRPDPAEERVGELLRFERGNARREGDDERLVDPRRLQQLEAPLERREQLDAVPQHEPRVGPEGHHRHGSTAVPRGVEHAPVPPVHTVEAPDRDRALPRRELGDAVSDDHSRASASSGRMNRSGSASSTENGPISSRRSVRQ
jgi:hypothetical protein